MQNLSYEVKGPLSMKHWRRVKQLLYKEAWLLTAGNTDKFRTRDYMLKDNNQAVYRDKDRTWWFVERNA